MSFLLCIINDIIIYRKLGVVYMPSWSVHLAIAKKEIQN